MPASRHFSMRVFKILVLSHCLKRHRRLLHSEITSKSKVQATYSRSAQHYFILDSWFSSTKRYRQWTDLFLCNLKKIGVLIAKNILQRCCHRRKTTTMFCTICWIIAELLSENNWHFLRFLQVFYFLKTFITNNFCLETQYAVIAWLVSSSNVNTRILKTHIKKCRQAGAFKTKHTGLKYLVSTTLFCTIIKFRPGVMSQKQNRKDSKCKLGQFLIENAYLRVEGFHS